MSRNTEHTPPAVGLQVPQPQAMGRCIAVFWLLETLFVLGVSWAYGLNMVRWTILLTLYMVVAAALWAGWKNMLHGHLRWDGQDWHLMGQTLQHAPQIALDFQHHMLVKFPGHGWMWLSGKDSSRQTWLALRRSLHTVASG